MPVSLFVEGLGEWELLAAGTDEQGLINPPPGRVQWYDASPHPGAAGTAVLAGHVRIDGVPDVFAELGTVGEGDRVRVTDQGGSVRTFEVATVRTADKDALMVDPAVWGPGDEARLAIVTCDAASAVEAGGHLADNLVVEAVAVP